MTEKLYICSGISTCYNTDCLHYTPHRLKENCLDGICRGVEIMCIQYVPKEFNLKLVIKND